jgi:cell wall assembly regulator SMI1
MQLNSIRASWEKISFWYASNAPKGALTLSPGASEDEIQLLERLLGVNLPADIRESYAIHDGNRYLQSFFPDGGALQSIDRIAQAWLVLADRVSKGLVVYAENVFPEGPIKKTWWNLRWIPIMETGAGDYGCVDLEPANGGHLGQVISFVDEVGPLRVLASSWQEYLSQFADDLEHGRIRYDTQSERLCVIQPK